jgi:hypothetical protein
VWSGAADLCRLQWKAATECNIMLPLAAFPLRRCPAALCNSILPFNSKRSIATSSGPRRRGDSGRSNSSKVRFARHPTRIGFGDSTNWRDLSQSACIYNGSPTRRTKPSKRRSERSGSTQGSILRYVSPLSCAARDFSSHANASSFSSSPA